MDDIYRQYILEHYREPHNHGTLNQPDIHAADTNPLCGDRVAIDLKVQDGRVSEVRFNGRGCAISQASASMLTDRIEGATMDELKALTPPPEDAAMISQGIQRMQSTLDTAQTNTTAIIDPIGISGPELNAYGLTSCFSAGPPLDQNGTTVPEP